MKDKQATRRTPGRSEKTWCIITCLQRGDGLSMLSGRAFQAVETGVLLTDRLSTSILCRTYTCRIDETSIAVDLRIDFLLHVAMKRSDQHSNLLGRQALFKVVETTILRCIIGLQKESIRGTL
jgi:hypothetical protein